MLRNMRERIDYYDRAKGLLILLVIIGHVLQYANPKYDIIPYSLGQSFINSFHMSAFFVISGMLFDNEGWRSKKWIEFLLKRIRTLLIPYVFFESVGILYISFILQRDSIVDGIYKMATFRCNIGADWFLSAMFVAQVIYYLYVKHPYKIVWGLFTVLSFFCTWYMPDGHWWQVLCRGMLGFSFIFLGNVFKRFLANVPVQPFKAYVALGIAFGVTVICAAFCFKYGGNDFYLCIVNNPLLFVAGGLSGVYFVLAVARTVPFKWLSWIGENSLIIMGTHQLVLYTIPSCSCILWGVGAFILILVIELPIIYLTGRFCPVLVGKSKLDERK